MCTLNCFWKPVVLSSGVALDIWSILTSKLFTLYAVSPHSISSSKASWMNTYCACYITHHLPCTRHNNICTSDCTMKGRWAHIFLTHSYTSMVFILVIFCSIISKAMYIPVRPIPSLSIRHKAIIKLRINYRCLPAVHYYGWAVLILHMNLIYFPNKANEGCSKLWHSVIWPASIKIMLYF